MIFDSHEDYANQLRVKQYIPAPLRPVIAGAYHIFETGAAKKIDAVIIPTEQGEGDFFKGRCRRCVTVGNTPVMSEIYDRFDDDRDYSGKKVCYIGGLHRAATAPALTSYSEDLLKAKRSSVKSGACRNSDVSITEASAAEKKWSAYSEKPASVRARC